MKKLMLYTTSWLSLFLLLFAACSPQEEETALLQPAIIPLPVQMEVGNGSYTLTRQSAIRLQPATDELLQIAALLNEKIEPATSFSLPVKKDGKIELILNNNETLGEEGYTLSVTRLGVQVTANQPAGLFYGVQSLLQLLPPEIKSEERQIAIKDWKIPTVEIVDKPQFAWRGLMLDVSRHWFTKEEVKRYIDQLAEYKMNVFHWHLTDDQGWRIEIKSLPELTGKGAWRASRVGQWWQREPWQPDEATTYGGYYTHEDIKEVLAYAAERYVRVIPEIDVPGHSVAALFAYPQLACLKAPMSVNVGEKFYTEVENSLCIGKDFTFEFMDKVLTEVAELFPDEYVHIGGDECYKGFWQKCPDCQRLMKREGLKNVEELQSWFIHRMEELLKEKGKKLIGWDEIHEGGLSPDATVMSWRGMEGGIKAAEAGHHVIMTPANHCYLDLYQGEPSVEPDTYSMARLTDSYHFDPVPEGVPEEMILGGQGNLWAESVPTFRHAEYMTWPRGWALAEVLWSGPARNDWAGFIPRVEHHFERADQAQINYARSMYNAIVTPYLLPDNELIIELSTEIAGLVIYYTFDNTDPDRYTSLYQQPLRIPKDATWLRMATYRGEEQVGKVITLTIRELEKRAQSDRRPVIGNLTN